MKTKKSFILSIIITILTTIVLFASEVSATTYGLNQADAIKNNGKIGDMVQLNGGFSRGRNDTFCFEHKTGFSGGLYKITDIIEIDGRTAKSVGTGKTAVKKANVIMNYLLFKGNYRREMYLKDGSNKMSSRNIAIWSYQNTWLNALGNGFLKNNWKNENNRYNIDKYFTHQEKEAKEAAKKLRQEAINFSNNTAGEASISITGAKTVNEYATNTYGPFKAKFTGDSVSLTVTGANGIIASNKIRIYSDKACTKSISNIKSNSNFYIKVTDGTKIKNVTVNVSSTVLSAKIFFLAKNDFWSGHGQGIILIKPGERTEKKSVTFGTSTEGSLTIKKINKDTKKALKAGFKIQTSSGKWLSGSNGSYNYNNSFAGATVYTSTITLNNLRFDTYKIYEVKAPSGYVLEEQAGYDKTNKWVYFGTTTVNANNAKVTKTYTNEKTRGKITITKIDKKTKKALAAGFKIQTPSGKWLSGNNGSYNYDNAFEGATVYKSPITLKDLKFGTYKVYEVKAPNGYILEDQTGYDKTNKWVYFGTAIINKNTPKVTKTLTNNKTNTGSLTIQKLDKDTGASLAAGFKIQTPSGKWLSGNNGSYNYDNAFTGATVYTSPKTLDGLKYGKYKVYEVVAPQGYDLTAQDGYDKKNNWVDFGTATINSKNTKVTKKIANVQKISIKGYVWVDTEATKSDSYNSKYDNRESKVAGVTVKLVNKSTKKAIATIKTNANGEYIFDKLITKSQLKDYYVEFNYNGVKAKIRDNENKEIEDDISKYIPVAFNSEKVNEIIPNGSRALMDSVAYEDTKVSGIATTYKGTDKETIYGLSGNLYNKLMEGAVLNNINLGIKKIPNAKYSLDQKLEYVKITIKGFEYTYKYNNPGDSSKVAAPKVSCGDKTDVRGYSAYIYPADIMYNPNDIKKQLQVYVGYRIDINNINNTDINELYKEKALKISSLTNRFDTKRYTLNDSNWKLEKDGTAKYNKKIEDIGPDKTSIQRIQFSVKREAILDILKHPDGIIDDFPTKATTTGYHEYTRDDYSWSNSIKKNQTHRTINETNSSEAPYLVFKLGEERTINGKVFKDTAIESNDGQKLGNGEYDNNEKLVKDVKVELLDVSEDTTDITKLKVSHLYPESKISEFNPDTSKDIGIEAVTSTDENGAYTFSGIVPGYYYLRFIYGNGDYKVTDLAGNEIEAGNVNSKIGDSTINVIDYKSTIVKNAAAKGAITAGTAIDENWYKKLGSTNSSVTIDNLDTRIKVNNGNSQVIMAGTAKIFIRVENTDVNEAEMKVSDNGDTVKLASSVYEGLNLGLIEVPKQEAKLEKIITKMKLTNAQNNIVLDGNPEKDSLKGVSDLDNDKNNGGSTYARAELQDEMISGSKLELTYTIRVTNISDVNYYNKEYYWFGDITNANKEVTLDLNELSDYLDNTLQFNQGASDQRFTISTNETVTNQNEDLDNKTIIKLSNWNTKLYTEKNTTRNDNNCKPSDSVILVAQRILSTNDEDMDFVNQAKITNLNRGTDGRDNSTEKDTEIQTIKPVVLNYEAQARATITPPTGADRLTIIIYTIAGTLALAMLSAGVVVIKKYVVK